MSIAEPEQSAPPHISGAEIDAEILRAMNKYLGDYLARQRASIRLSPKIGSISRSIARIHQRIAQEANG